MSIEDRIRWDQKYRERPGQSPDLPSDWLVANLGLLPRGGRVLDLAAGTGGNSLLLASRGWRVTAVDVSQVGLAIGRRVAGPLAVQWVAADLDDYAPDEAAYDLVLCIRFLDRQRLPSLVDRALRPNGLFLAETCNWRELESPQPRVRNPSYLLGAREWLTLFGHWEILAHDETGRSSRLLVRKPQSR